MSYKLAIFDLDGTILNSLEDLTDSVNHALEMNAFPTHSIDEIRTYIGNGARLLAKRSLPADADEGTVDKVLADFQAYYKTHGDIKTRPYDGVVAALDTLRARGVKLAVLSNKPDAATQTLCKRYFGDIFDYVSGEKTGIPRKPAPDGVEVILSQLGVNKCDAVYIGDSEVDVETAINSGLDCISTAWGFRDETTLKAAGTKCIVYDADALLDAILGT